MTRIKVKVVGSGTEADPYRVDLPSWQGIEFDTDKGKKPPNAFAIVEVPDDECTEKGKVNLKRLGKKYRPIPEHTDDQGIHHKQKGRDWLKQKPDIGEDMVDDGEKVKE